MPTFDVLQLPELARLTLREPLYELRVNAHSEYRDFCEQVTRTGTHTGDLDKIQTMLLLHAQGLPIPPAKFKQLKRPKNDPIPDFEFKTSNLRLYLFKHPVSGKVVVCGGGANKTQQPQDIARMRRLKKQYYDSLS